MGSVEISSTMSLFTASSLNNSRVQWLLPSGASLQAMAMICASWEDESFFGCPGRGSSKRAVSSPSIAYFCLARCMVQVDTFRISWISSSVFPLSDKSRAIALRNSRAERFPVDANCCKKVRSSSVRCTLYFLFTMLYILTYHI